MQKVEGSSRFVRFFFVLLEEKPGYGSKLKSPIEKLPKRVCSD